MGLGVRGHAEEGEEGVELHEVPRVRGRARGLGLRLRLGLGLGLGLGVELHEVLVEELVGGRVDEDVEDDVQQPREREHLVRG